MNKVLTVKELTEIISDVFLNDLNNNFIVKGEVFSVSNKGHIWFTLQDSEEKYTMSGVVWKSIVENKKIELEVGDIIIARGRIKLYGPQNRYNFCVYELNKKETIENQFKKKLKFYEEKGYFNKKNIVDKMNIKKIALITSLEGEAVNDFKKTLSNRFFFGKVYMKDVNVQGEKCASTIINAIDKFEKKVDIILITRGGGSFMDLNEFNNDDLIERIYKCKTPVYCAIGHERDYTICDYVCDLRSSTPTSLALEVSYDKNVLENKYRLCYENELKKYIEIERNIKRKLDIIKEEIYEYIMENKPNGFYFDNKYITKLKDFKKLCKEKFKIKLLDCEIEFKIENYNINKEYDSKYTYDKYLELYKEPNKIKGVNGSLNSYIEKFRNNKNFGEKNNFLICKKLLGILNKYYKSIEKIKNIEEEKYLILDYDKNNLDLEYLLDNLENYKKYLNFLNNIKINKIKIEKEEIKNINKIFNKYIKINETSGITKKLIKMYNILNNYKISYEKI